MILKDYVNGKLLWCKPPPGEQYLSDKEFNNRLYDRENLPLKRQMQLAANEARQDGITSTGDGDGSLLNATLASPSEGSKTQKLDKRFFSQGKGSAGHLTQPFNYKYTEQGKHLSGRKAKTMAALEKGVDPSELLSGKKHFKGNRRVKQRNVERTSEYE